MTTVSIIIPVYNVKKYLRRCLDSIVNQTLKDIEIICINDNSTDNSLEILKEYASKDNRIVILNQKTKGPSAARNAGIKIAKGEFIGFVDSDDFIDLNFYEKLYKKAKETNSDVSCASIIREKNNKKEFLIEYKKEETSQNIRENCILAGVPKHNYVWNKIYKREMLLNSKIQFPDGMNYEDVIFTPQIMEITTKIVSVPNVFYHYWKNKKSIVSTSTDKNRGDMAISQKFLENFCKKYNLNYLDTKKYIYRKEYFFCGIKILKICRLRATTKYLLFGILPILVCKEQV